MRFPCALLLFAAFVAGALPPMPPGVTNAAKSKPAVHPLFVQPPPVYATNKTCFRVYVSTNLSNWVCVTQWTCPIIAPQNYSITIAASNCP